MENKIIYEKRYPKWTEADYARMLEETESDASTHSRIDSATFFKNLMENTVRIVIPERMENCSFFIAMAKEVGENNRIDLIITECEDRYVAEFHFDRDNTNFGLKDLIEYADDICVGCTEGEAVVSIIYYTHATYRSEHRVTPEDRTDFLTSLM